jgi:hypothetical protein
LFFFFFGFVAFFFFYFLFFINPQTHRTDDSIRSLLKDAGLTILAVVRQTNFPRQLYPVNLYACTNPESPVEVVKTPLFMIPERVVEFPTTATTRSTEDAEDDENEQQTDSVEEDDNGGEA